MTADARQVEVAGVPLTRIADWLAVAVVVSLPWSTSATGILVVCLGITILATADRNSWDDMATKAAIVLPVLVVAYALAGTLWSDVPWQERFRGLAPISKLLIIPLLLVHFRRTGAGTNVIAGLLISSLALLLLSWFVALIPEVPWQNSDFGVPVKDYISQSGFFSLCIVILLDRAMADWRSNPQRSALLVGLAIVFLANIVFIATGRTSLVSLTVLLALVGVRHCRKYALAGFLAVLVLAAAVAWASSPYLRYRVSNVAVELTTFSEGNETSSGARIEFWKKSVEIVAQDPIAGHGTGSTRAVMSRAAGVSPLAPGAPANPHNQVFAMAIPLGLIGVALMLAMWVSHLRLFLMPGPVAWFGLAVVVQNIVGGLFNSHLFDFTQGWLYVLGVGVAGGTLMNAKRKQEHAAPSALARP